MSDFYVGQEVVCVDDVIHPEWQLPGYEYEGSLGVSRGAQYTVRCVEICPIHGVLVLKVNGIVRSPPDGGFHAARFAPLKESNIQIFREMCRTVKRNIDA